MHAYEDWDNRLCRSSLKGQSTFTPVKSEWSSIDESDQIYAYTLYCIFLIES